MNNPIEQLPQRTVADLQRELLAICKGGNAAETYMRVNGITEWPSLRGEFTKVDAVRQLRKQIAAIDPKACLYYGWAGHTDDKGPDVQAWSHRAADYRNPSWGWQ